MIVDVYVKKVLCFILPNISLIPAAIAVSQAVIVEDLWYLSKNCKYNRPADRAKPPENKTIYLHSTVNMENIKFLQKCKCHFLYHNYNKIS